MKRACKNCEYLISNRYGRDKCCFNPPTVSGEHQRGIFPETQEDYFCSKWEPCWDKNPMINKAWKEFLTVVKLSRENKE